jgi:hypothetical protein
MIPDDPMTRLWHRARGRRLTWIASVVLAALLALGPMAVQSGQVAGLTVFVNGQLADADEVNANFDIVSAAIADNAARLTDLENLLPSACPPGEYVRGISAAVTLVCAP